MTLAERVRSSWQTIALGLLMLVFATVVARNAWLCDDAFISFRSADNFVNGYGLRWNIAERVQPYTHPLWMLPLTFCAWIGDFETTPLLISIVLSIAAAAVLALRIAPDRGSAIVAVGILTLSKSFVDYSTSGLENPLSHLLLVLFAALYFGPRASADEPLAKPDDRQLLLCVGVAGLAVLNRMDTLLLYAPAIASLLLPRRSPRAIGLALLALAPLIVWECFSLFYYGFAFPNTAYAKLGTGVPSAALLAQGLSYLRASFSLDPIALVGIVAGCACAVWKRDRGAALALGVLLYLAYVLRIGGDFMAGRHLALPLLASVILLCRALPHWRAGVPAALAAALALGIAAPHPPWLGDGWIYRGEPIPELHGVMDERAVYAPYTARFNGFQLLEHPWAEQGRVRGRRGPSVVPKTAIGLYAFHAGPEVFIVDVNALSDPLLARLPARERGASGWRIGHHTRDLPDGYLETLRHGENRLADPGLAELYSSLELVTRGELWSGERLREVFRQQTGYYRSKLEAYAASLDAASSPYAN